jgi:hypothetical protein
MNSNVLIAIVVIVFAADVLWNLYQNKKRDELLKKFDEYLGKKDYASFDELIDSKQVRQFFPVFNINYLKLNESLIKEDMEEIDRAFDSFDMRMNKVQKEALYKKGFYYYLGIENKEKTDLYYEQLKQLNIKDQHTLDMMYDIYIAKGYKYLDEINDKIKNLPQEKQMPFYALLSDMYRNKGDEEKADEYEKKVSEYTDKLKEKM